MLVPVKWLKEYVDFQITPEELADKLVSCGFEIEGMTDLSAAIQNVVSAEIVAMEKHPNADKLQICQLNIGKDKPIQVITAATNVHVGDKVPVALAGAVLPGGKEIHAGELRGVLSNGMMCGGEELNLTEHDYVGAGVYGILILEKDTPIGVDINVILGNDDIVLDVGVTSNRTDANSIYGIAREVGAVTGLPVKPLPVTFQVKNPQEIGKELKIANQATDLCLRYMAGMVTDVKQMRSPKMIRDRLRAVGIRPINNLVDVTNYVLIEVGQPMHAFDLAKIAGGEIVIRRASEGETIIALDDKEYTLNGENLVIANAEHGMAVAGVMGGRDDSVTDTTKTVVFESARFARDNVRRTARKLNLHSDSSARFEKGVDYASQELGMYRALNLMDTYGWGNVVAGILDNYPVPREEKFITFTEADIERILGVSVPKERILKILNDLTLTTTEEADGLFVTKIPGYREDMVGVNDIAEEVIRFYGYDHIQPTLMRDCETVSGGKSADQLAMDKLKEVLMAHGMYEIVTYSFTTPKFFDYLHLPKDSELRNAVRLANPMGEDVSIMRTTLAHSMMKTLATNFMRGNKQGRFFEVAKTYRPKALPLTELPIEKNVLCLGALGDEFYSFKSIIEEIYDIFHLNVRFRKGSVPYLHPTRTAEIVTSNGETIGYLGEVDDLVTKEYDIDKKVYLAELDVEYLLANRIGMLPFRVIPKYPSVERDLALVTPREVEADAVLDAIREGGAPILESARIFDVYSGGQILSGKKSVAVKLVFQSAERTLKDSDVNERIDACLAILKEKLGISLR